MKRPHIYLLVCILFSLCVTACVTACGGPLYNNYNRKDILMGNSNYAAAEQAVILTELGITGITPEMIRQMDEAWNALPEDCLDSMNPTAMLLTYVGAGSYDYDTWEFTPSSSQVYCFDMEVFNIDQMYTDFLKGVASINGGDFAITEVLEDTSGTDPESGTGTRQVSFLCNGRSYTLKAKSNADWFDMTVLNGMNDILAQEGCSKKLFFMTDGYQECILFYCTDEWAELFTKKTGCPLYDAAG